jgi:preprotein translocase subunit SecF
MIDFLKYRKLNLALSTLFIVISAVAWYTRGVTYSIDFEGGTQILLGFSKPVGADHVRELLVAKGYVGAITREFSPTEILVRVKEFTSDTQGEAERLRAVFQGVLSDNEVTIKSKDSVGPAAGAAMRMKAIYAVLIGLLLMLFYIMFRFEFSFAIGAVLSLLHDALTILGFFILFGFEISPNVIVAILTILGYSINDTIVIFDRIRHNITKMGSVSLHVVVNTSINQTLTRTILTSFATSLTVVAFLVLGGEGLRDLSLALLVGIMVGTYSSIYVASPIMMMLHKGTAK